MKSLVVYPGHLSGLDIFLISVCSRGCCDDLTEETELLSGKSRAGQARLALRCQKQPGQKKRYEGHWSPVTVYDGSGRGM